MICDNEVHEVMKYTVRIGNSNKKVNTIRGELTIASSYSWN